MINDTSRGGQIRTATSGADEYRMDKRSESSINCFDFKSNWPAALK